MTAMSFETGFAACPLVAILRGVHPKEVVTIGEVLVTSGIRLIEVPLNSPDPFDSITLLAKALAGRAVIGAGTVLDTAAVEAVASAGGTLIVAPNADEEVVAFATGKGLVAIPGFGTATEAFRMLRAGAAALKLFPAEAARPAVVSAMRAVLPEGTRILPVGGITVEAMASWQEAGAAGFGLGSALYKPGMMADEVRVRAQAFTAALRPRAADPRVMS